MVHESLLEVGTVGNAEGRSKVVVVSVIGLRSWRQPLELSDRIGAPIRVEEVIRPRTAKYVVEAERYRVGAVLCIVGPLDFIAKAQVDSDIGTESPCILGEHAPCLLSRPLSQVPLQSIVRLLIRYSASAHGN